jgi:hypothetical protein
VKSSKSLHLENTFKHTLIGKCFNKSYLPVINKVIMNYEKIFRIYILETYFLGKLHVFCTVRMKLKNLKVKKSFLLYDYCCVGLKFDFSH